MNEVWDLIVILILFSLILIIDILLTFKELLQKSFQVIKVI